MTDTCRFGDRPCATADVWGNAELLSLAALACGEWEQPRSTFDGKPGKSEKPPWWDEFSNVWLLRRDGRTWALASDGRAAVAFAMDTNAHDSWDGDDAPIGLPRGSLDALAGRSPRGGVRAALSGGVVSVAPLSCGYTGRVQVSKAMEWPAPESTGRAGLLLDDLLDADGGGGPVVALLSTAEALAGAFTCLSARSSHSFYSPCEVSFYRGGDVRVARKGYGGDFRARVAARSPRWEGRV